MREKKREGLVDFSDAVDVVYSDAQWMYNYWLSGYRRVRAHKLKDHREEVCALALRVLTSIGRPEKMTDRKHVRW